MNTETSTVGHMKGKARLAFVRSLPCAVRGPGCFGDIHAHHAMGGGMGMKSDDSRTLPLCQNHHTELHSLTGHFKGWNKLRIKFFEALVIDVINEGMETT